MRRLPLIGLVVGVWACAVPETGLDTLVSQDSADSEIEPEPYNDPDCAFDETGCLPADLLLRVEASEEGPSAVLKAIAPVEWTTWERQGMLGRVDWQLPGGSRLVEGPDPDPRLEEAGAVAPMVELRLEGDASRVTVEIARRNTLEGRSEDLRELDLATGPTAIELDPGTYILRVLAWWPEGEAEFFFSFRRA